MAAPVITNIGSVQSKTSSTTTVLTVTAAVPIGSTLIVSFATNPTNANLITAADNATGTANVYTQRVAAVQGTTTTGVRTVILTAPVTRALAVGNTITITHPTTAARAASAIAVTGLDNANLLDATGTAQGSGTTAGSTFQGSVTTVANETLVIAAVGTEGLAADTFEADRSYREYATNGTTGSTAATNITIRGGTRYFTKPNTYIYSSTGTARLYSVAMLSLKVTTGSLGPFSGQITAPIETGIVGGTGDVADDAAIWVHPTDSSLSAVIACDKDTAGNGGLYLFNLSGTQINTARIGNAFNNIDIKYNFQLATNSVDLIGATNQTTKDIEFFTINPSTRVLTQVGTVATGMATVYGFCMYRSTEGIYYCFVTADDTVGELRQFVLDGSSGSVTGSQVRTFNVGSLTEGMTCDDATDTLYVGEETGGIWKYNAAPTGGSTRTLMDGVGNGRLTADVEGMSIYYRAGGAGYLIVASQGSSTFAVYDRITNAYLGSFSVVGGGGADLVTITDGIDVTNRPLGASTFASGMLVVHDATNTGGVTSNFKYVPWASIATLGGLSTDTTYDPRSVVLPTKSLAVDSSFKPLTAYVSGYTITTDREFTYEFSNAFASTIPAGVTPATTNAKVGAPKPTVSILARQSYSGTWSDFTDDFTSDFEGRPVPVSVNATVQAKKPTVQAQASLTLTPSTVNATVQAKKPTVISSASQAFLPTTVNATAQAKKPTVAATSTQSFLPATTNTTVRAKKPVLLGTAGQTLLPATANAKVSAKKPSIAVTAGQTFLPATTNIAVAIPKPAVQATATQTFIPANASATVVAAKPSVSAASTQTFLPASAGITLQAPKPSVIALAGQTFIPVAVDARVTAPKPTVRAVAKQAANAEESFFTDEFTFEFEGRPYPATADATVQAPKPSVSAEAYQSFQPTTINAIVRLPKPTVSASSTQTFIDANASAVVRASKPTVSVSAYQITTVTVDATVLAPKPSVRAEAGQTFLPATVNVRATLPKPTARATAGQTFLPATANIKVRAPKPTAQAISSQSFLAATANATLSAKKPTVTATATQTFVTANASVTVRAPKPAIDATAGQTFLPATTSATVRTKKPTAKATASQTFVPATANATVRAKKPTAKAASSQSFLPATANVTVRAKKPVARATTGQTFLPASSNIVVRVKKPVAKATSTQTFLPVSTITVVRAKKPTTKGTASQSFLTATANIRVRPPKPIIRSTASLSPIPPVNLSGIVRAPKPRTKARGGHMVEYATKAGIVMDDGSQLALASGYLLLLATDSGVYIPVAHPIAIAQRTVEAGYGADPLAFVGPLDPAELKYFTVTWDVELNAANDSIVPDDGTLEGQSVFLNLSGAAVAAGIQVHAFSQDNRSVTFWLKVNPSQKNRTQWNGTGETHIITITIITIRGQVFERDISFKVKQL